MPEAISVGVLHLRAKELGEEAFREEYGDAFFMRGAGQSSLRKPRVFQETSKGQASPAALGGVVREPLKRRAGHDVLEFMIFILKPNDPKSRRITIGRTGNNDVVIADQSVSKFHAVLTRDDGGNFLVKDVGSRTGTRVNDEVLPLDEWRPLLGGEEVAFGEITLSFLGVASLHNFLKRVIPMPTTP